MIQRHPMVRILATALILTLPVAWTPLTAEEGPATLVGSILSAVDHAPLAGARLHVGDPRSGKIYSSGIVDERGDFVVADLPSASYELAVESQGKLYVVGTPLQLAPGAMRTVNVELNPDAAPRPPQTEDEKKKRKGGATIWDNQLTAALLVVTGAIGVGLLLDDDDSNTIIITTSETMTAR